MKAIKTTYLGPTNFRGARIVATDCDKNRIVLPYQDMLGSDENHERAARALCEKMNWNTNLKMGGFKNFNVHVFI